MIYLDENQKVSLLEIPDASKLLEPVLKDLLNKLESTDPEGS